MLTSLVGHSSLRVHTEGLTGNQCCHQAFLEGPEEQGALYVAMGSVLTLGADMSACADLAAVDMMISRPFISASIT